MRGNQFENHREETLNYLRAMKQKIQEEQAEEASQRVPKNTKRRGLILTIKEFVLPEYGKAKIYQ